MISSRLKTIGQSGAILFLLRQTCFKLALRGPSKLTSAKARTPTNFADPFEIYNLILESLYYTDSNIMLINDLIYHYLIIEAENFAKERIIHTSHESWWCEGKDRLNLMVEVLVLNSRDKEERTSKRDANERKFLLTSDFKGIVHAGWKIITAHLIPSNRKKDFENFFAYSYRRY